MRYLVIWSLDDGYVETAFISAGKELQSLLQDLAQHGLEFLKDVPDIEGFPTRSVLILQGAVVVPRVRITAVEVDIDDASERPT